MQILLPTNFLSAWMAKPSCGKVAPARIVRRTLPARTALTLSLPAAGRINCVRGRLWITREGSTEDVVLETGRTFSCVTACRVVLESLEESQAEFDHPIG